MYVDESFPSDSVDLELVVALHVVLWSVTNELLLAPKGFRYSGNAMSVRPTDAHEPVPLRDPPDQ